MARKFFVGGNWKMNGTVESGQKLVQTLRDANIDANTEVVVAPPALHLLLVKDMLKSTPISVAGQNAYHKPSGAFTGEVSVSQLQDAGIPWVILGHSERRTIFKEGNNEVAEKTAAAIDHNLKVILCVGETLEERESNKTLDVICGQLDAAASSTKDWRCVGRVGAIAVCATGNDHHDCHTYLTLHLFHPACSKVVVAYEPVWAIGTGKVATAEQVRSSASLRAYKVDAC